MNAERRKSLAKIRQQIEDAKEAIEAIMDEEQEAFDNLPESFQYSGRGDLSVDIIIVRDQYNSSKFWVVKKYSCGNYYVNQAIKGRLLYKSYVRITRQRLAAIGLDI